MFDEVVVVSYRNSTSNHNPWAPPWLSLKLYLIEILHQTTTNLRSFYSVDSCILSKFYIKPQLFGRARVVRTVVSYRNSTSNHNFRRPDLSASMVVSYRNSTSNHNQMLTDIAGRVLYLIEILHQTTTYGRQRVPQKCCILSKFYIKPQPSDVNALFNRSCILSKFYIKPQPSTMMLDARCVVSYRNSTSNHNWVKGLFTAKEVVSYRNSTSNHNFSSVALRSFTLYLIEILHQTTTTLRSVAMEAELYLIEILHQTTTVALRNAKLDPLYLIEILHQTTTKRSLTDTENVVSYRNSTSNHNRPNIRRKVSTVVSYRNSTSNHNSCLCISEETAVVSYRNSTSNHNRPNIRRKVSTLYLIEILHQTTTLACLIPLPCCCILSKFYIKPQHDRRSYRKRVVVSYRNSTSNHNLFTVNCQRFSVVSYRNSTSNHNVGPHID